MKSGHRFLLCSVLCLAIAGAATADNLLVNGDFETGDFTGWVVLGESPSSMGSVLSGERGERARQHWDPTKLAVLLRLRGLSDRAGSTPSGHDQRGRTHRKDLPEAPQAVPFAGLSL